MRKRIITISAAVAALGIIGVGALSAQAHDGAVEASCTAGLTINLANYPDGSTIGGTIDGKPYDRTEFDGSYFDRIPWEPTVDHGYSLSVVSGDGDHRYDRTYAAAVTGCVPTPSPTPTTPPVTETPTPEPTTPPVTETPTPEPTAPPVTQTPTPEPTPTTPPATEQPTPQPTASTPPVVQPTEPAAPSTAPAVVPSAPTSTPPAAVPAATTPAQVGELAYTGATINPWIIAGACLALAIGIGLALIGPKLRRRL